MRHSVIAAAFVLGVAVLIQGQRSPRNCRTDPPNYEVYNLPELVVKFVASVPRLLPGICDPRPVENIVEFRCKTTGDDRFYTVDFASGRNFDRMDRNAKWAFVIHGFLGTCRKDWPLEMLRVLSASEPMNVCCVDWSRWASCNYVPDATRYVYAVGDYVAYIIRSMSNFWNIDLQRFIIIGHSFGGIITGIIGKQFTNPKLPIGIALDPAGILYTRVVDVPENRRLRPTDYVIVKTIITDEFGLGSGDASGTVNIYANGAELQPQCTIPFPCGHFSACTYFIESMRPNQTKIYPIISDDRQTRDFFTLYANDKPGNYNLTTTRCYPYTSPPL